MLLLFYLLLLFIFVAKRTALIIFVCFNCNPLNIRTSVERPLTVRPYLYGRYILGIFWVYMKVF